MVGKGFAITLVTATPYSIAAFLSVQISTISEIWKQSVYSQLLWGVQEPWELGEPNQQNVT